MANLLETELLSADIAVERLQRLAAPSGLHYGLLGPLPGSTAAPGATAHASPENILRLVNAVPASLASALHGTTYAFVPLALSGARLRGDQTADIAVPGSDPTLIAPHVTPELSERAICHRNAQVRGADFVFLSAGLHTDSFALAFEFFINVAHDLVDIAGMPASFADLLNDQVNAGVRGETSMDAWEHRAAAFGPPPADDAVSRTRITPPPAAPLSQADRDRARRDYQNSAFADAVAIYLLAIFLDFDYADLREREYPLLAPPALAVRLRAVNALYPPNSGYTFNILYRRRA